MQLSYIFVLVAIASSSLAAPVPGQGMSTLRAQDAATKHGLSIQHEATHNNALLTAAHLQGALLKQAHSNAKQSIGRRSPSPGQAMSALRTKQDKPKQVTGQHYQYQEAALAHAQLQAAQLHAKITKEAKHDAVQAIGRRSPSPGQGMSSLRAQQDAIKHESAQQQAALHANALLTSTQMHAQLIKQANNNAVHAIGRRSPLPGQGMSSMRSSSKDTKVGNHVASKHAAANAHAQHTAGSHEAAANANAVSKASAQAKAAHQVSNAAKNSFSDMDSGIF